MKEEQIGAHSDLGMVMHCNRHELVLPKLAEFGYSHVHFARFSTLPPKELRRISERCNKHGLKPFSAHGPSTFLPGDVSGLGEMIEKHKRTIDQAAILGVGSITFHMASVEGIRDNETEQFIGKVGRESFDEMNSTTLYELARHAAGHRMPIALENRDQGQVADYCKTIGALRSMIERVGEPNVGICLDSGHANTHGDLDCAEMILEAGEQLIDTHFHDNYGYLCDGKIWGNGVINDLHRPPGIGTINWLAVIEALEEINYKRPIMFEVSLQTKEDDLDTLLHLTRDNWHLMNEARDYVRECMGGNPL